MRSVGSTVRQNTSTYLFHIQKDLYMSELNGVNDWSGTGAKLGGLCRSFVFSLWASGELGSVKIGRRRFSTDRQIAEYLARLESQVSV